MIENLRVGQRRIVVRIWRNRIRVVGDGVVAFLREIFEKPCTFFLLSLPLCLASSPGSLSAQGADPLCPGGLIAIDLNPFHVCDSASTRRGGILYDHSSRSRNGIRDGDELGVDCGGSTLRSCDLATFPLQVYIDRVTSRTVERGSGVLHILKKEGLLNGRRFVTYELDPSMGTFPADGEPAHTGRIVVHPTRGGRGVSPYDPDPFWQPTLPDPERELLTGRVHDLLAVQPFNFTLEGIVLMARYFREHLGMEYVVGDGGSFGSIVLQSLAQLDPTVLDAILAGGVTGDLQEFRTWTVLQRDYAHSAKEFLELFTPYNVGNDLLIKGTAAFGKTEADLRSYSGGFTIPALVETGLNDPHYRSRRMEEAAAEAAGGGLDWIQWHSVPEAGHGDHLFRIDAASRRDKVYSDMYQGIPAPGSSPGAQLRQHMQGSYADYSLGRRTLGTQVGDPAAISRVSEIGGVGSGIGDRGLTVRIRDAGQDDLLVGNSEGWVRRISYDAGEGALVTVWERFLGSRVYDLAVADPDEDGIEEVLVGTGGALHVLGSASGDEEWLLEGYRDVKAIVVAPIVSSAAEIAFHASENRLVVAAFGSGVLADTQVGNLSDLAVFQERETTRLCGGSGLGRVVCFAHGPHPVSGETVAAAVSVSEALYHYPQTVEILSPGQSFAADPLLLAAGTLYAGNAYFYVLDLDGQLVKKIDLSPIQTLTGAASVPQVPDFAYAGNDKVRLRTSLGNFELDLQSETFQPLSISGGRFLYGDFDSSQAGEEVFALGRSIDLETAAGNRIASRPGYAGRFAVTAWREEATGEPRVAYLTNAAGGTLVRADPASGQEIGSQPYPFFGKNFPKKLERYVYQDMEQFVEYEHPGGNTRLFLDPMSGKAMAAGVEARCGLVGAFFLPLSSVFDRLALAEDMHMLYSAASIGSRAVRDCEESETGVTGPDPGTSVNPSFPNLLFSLINNQQYPSTPAFTSHLSQNQVFNKGDVEILTTTSDEARSPLMSSPIQDSRVVVATPGGSVSINPWAGPSSLYCGLGSGNTLAQGEMDGDGSTDFAVVTMFESSSDEQTLTVFSSNNDLPGSTGSCRLGGHTGIGIPVLATSTEARYPVSVLLADLRDDGGDEIIVGTLAGEILIFEMLPEGSLELIYRYGTGALNAGLHDSLFHLEPENAEGRHLLIVTHSTGILTLELDPALL